MNFGFYVPEFGPNNTVTNPDDQQQTSQPSLAEVAAANYQPLQFSQQQQAEQLLPIQQPMVGVVSTPEKPKGTKGDAPKPIGMACRACRLRKIRCGGERPRCSYCVKKGYECVLTPHKKRGRPRKNEQRAKPDSSASSNKQPVVASNQQEIPNHLGMLGMSGAPQDSGMKAMAMPADPMPDALMEGLDLDVRQLWAELTGLQGLDLPAELSALVANSATQAQEANTNSIPDIGPSFNLGVTLPAGMTSNAPANTNSNNNAGPEDSLVFANNYAFPRYDPGNRSSNELTTPPPIASQPQQPQQLNIQPQPALQRPQRMDSPSSSAHMSFHSEGPMTATNKDAANNSSNKPDMGDVLGIDNHKLQSNIDSSMSTESGVRARSASTQGGMPILQTIDEGIKLYFVYVHPWMPILHRPTFEKQVLDGTVDPILYYAVQAVAARFKEREPAKQGRIGRRPFKRGQRYARAARILLPAALKNSRLSTLQAITILALYMSVSGHWQEGAAYEKLAVQLAFIGQYHLLDEEFLLPPVTNNMGLYETGWSEHSHPARLEVLSRPGGILDHEQRRRAWWSIFQLERFNGMAMGRPPIIKPGWHWVWLPCSEELWAQDNPSGPLAWEMGLADFSQRPNSSVSNCRVDLILSLVMGQLLEQRTEMFRLFFPRVDRGTLFYDNLPTHSLGWTMRLRRLIEVVGSLERRIRQWHAELDRYADTFSARRHANFEMVGASCQIHLYACVLQIREHLFEDLLVNEEVNKASSVRTGPHTEQGSTGATTPANGSVPAAKDETLKQNGISDTAANSRELDFDLPSSRNSSVDLSAAFERHTGMPFERSTYQRGYMAKAKRPELTLQFVSDLDTLAQRCWDRSVAMADEIARLLRVHWLKPFDSAAGPSAGDLSGFVASSVNPGKSYDHQVGGAKLAAWTLGDNNNSGNTKGPQAPSGADARRPSSVSGSSVVVSSLDPDIADRFKLMNPQTPYHLFVAGKVQAARLKQAVTAQDRKRQRQGKQSDEDAEMEDTEAPAAEPKDNEDLVVEDAIRRINEIWDSQALTADVTAIEGRLDDIVSALDYCQLFWYSLNFASHLRYLKREAMKPLLHSVYRS